MIAAILAAALMQAGVPEGTQVVNPDGSIVLKQKLLSIDDVLHHHGDVRDAKSARREARRHDREMEKAIRKLNGDRTFTLPQAHHKGHRFRIVSAYATRR